MLLKYPLLPASLSFRTLVSGASRRSSAALRYRMTSTSVVRRSQLPNAAVYRHLVVGAERPQPNKNTRAYRWTMGGRSGR